MHLKSIIEISSELKDLTSRAQSDKLAPSDFSGATITLSNIGMVGGTTLAPVITTGQVCIGAIGRIQTLPRFNKSNQVIAEKIVTVNFAADHRVIDGATLARFVTKWKGYLESPGTMAAQLR